MKAETRELLKAVMARALDFARIDLGAERGLLVYEGFGLANGFNTASMWIAGDLSHTLLRSLLENREPLVLHDAIQDYRFKNQTSAILSGLRSILYVPVDNPGGLSGGMLYADSQKRAGLFNQQHLTNARLYVEGTLTPDLHRVLPLTGAALDFEKLKTTHWLD